jgi:hypothetical protein
MFFDRKVVLTGKTLLFLSFSVQLLIMAASPQEQELAQEQEQEQQHEPEPEPAAEMVPECAVPELMLGAAAVLERMARVVAAAKVAPASPAPMMMKRSLPLSPAADEPDEPPPREAVVSEDTKQYDRGRRKGDTHTHTPISCR